MAKEIYLYGGVYTWGVEDLMASIEENPDEEVVLRMNTPGGSVFAGWGLVAKMIEHGNVTIKVDGTAMSMGAFMLAFANKVEALDVSKIMIHRADMYVSNEADKAFLDSVNKDLRAKFAAKIDDVKLKEITGFNLKAIFENEKREDVFLSAKEAKAIGLVDKVVKMTPQEAKAFNDQLFNVAATAEKPAKTEESINKNQKQIEMTTDKLLADHPEVYKSILALGKTEGIAEHKELVSAWSEFTDIDAEAVTAGIESGVLPAMSQVIAFMKKGQETPGTADIEAAAAAATETAAPVEVAAEAKELAELEASVDAELGIKKETK